MQQTPHGGNPAPTPGTRQRQIEWPTRSKNLASNLRDLQTGISGAKVVLMILWSCRWNGGTWEDDIDQLCRWCEMGRSTLFAKLAALKEQGILSYESLSRGRYRFTVGHVQIGDLADEHRRQFNDGRSRIRTTPSPDSGLPQSRIGTGESRIGADTIYVETRETSSAATNRKTEVEEALSNSGMTAWRSGLKAARQRGATDTDILAAVASWRQLQASGQYGVGAMYCWLTEGSFPDVKEPHRRKAADLEAEFGATVRALSDVDYLRLLQRHDPIGAQIYREGGRSGYAIHVRALVAFAKSQSAADVAR